MPRPYIWPLMLPPCCGAEEQQHGEQLQPPEKHVERQHDLRQGGEARIAAERADLEAQAGPMLFSVANTDVTLVSAPKLSSETSRIEMTIRNTYVRK